MGRNADTINSVEVDHWRDAFSEQLYFVIRPVADSSQCSAFSEFADAASFAFVSDHAFVVPLHDYERGPCLYYYNFEPDDNPIRLVGLSTYAPQLDAIFSLPFDEDVSVVGTYGLEIEADSPILSPQPRSARRAGITHRVVSPRKFHSQDRSPLIAMRFACAYSVEDESDDKHFLLVAYASAFRDRVADIGCAAVIRWEDWRGSARLTLDGLGTQTSADRGIVFPCNVSADRVVVIDGDEHSSIVRIMDFNPVRFHNVLSQSTLEGFDLKVELSSNPRMRLVSNTPYDSNRWLDMASNMDGRGVGVPFIEATMQRQFSLMAGAIILEEHLLVMTRVSAFRGICEGAFNETFPSSGRSKRGMKIYQRFTFSRCS